MYDNSNNVQGLRTTSNKSQTIFSAHVHKKITNYDYTLKASSLSAFLVGFKVEPVLSFCRLHPTPNLKTRTKSWINLQEYPRYSVVPCLPSYILIYDIVLYYYIICN